MGKSSSSSTPKTKENSSGTSGLKIRLKLPSNYKSAQVEPHEKKLNQTHNGELLKVDEMRDHSKGKEPKGVDLSKEKDKEKDPKLVKKNNNQIPVTPSISLTDLEIKEDLYAFTLRKRDPRKHQKRPKHIQQAIDDISPGFNRSFFRREMESSNQKKEQPQALPDSHEKAMEVKVDLKKKAVEDLKAEVAEEKGEVKPQKQLNKRKNNKPICPHFRIKLTDEEIKEDLFILTGERRLSRNFQRRQKSVQREMDTMFPGMLLHTVTPDDYNVPGDNSRPEK